MPKDEIAPQCVYLWVPEDSNVPSSFLGSIVQSLKPTVRIQAIAKKEHWSLQVGMNIYTYTYTAPNIESFPKKVFVLANSEVP